MKILFNLEVGEEMTNFRIAEAVVNLCEEGWNDCGDVNAEVIARMILLQIGLHKEGTRNEQV